MIVGTAVPRIIVLTAYYWKSCRRTHKQVAVKMIRKKKWPRNYSEPDYLMKEMDIPKNLDHPCITKVLEVQSEKLFVIVMELAP